MKKTDFTHVDWDKEIEETPLKTDLGIARKSKNAVMTWVRLEPRLKEGFNKAEEAHVKANALRMIQYFLGKFLYHNARVYKREINWDDNYNPIKELDVEGVVESKLPLSKIKEIEKMFHAKENERRKEKKEQDGGYSEIKEMFKRRGIKVYRPKGLRREGDRDTVAIKHDKVRYHISIMKGTAQSRKDDVDEKIENHNKNIELYHELTKKAYLELQRLGIKDLWAMEGGGMQVQIFFGDITGYLGILYLDMRYPKKLRNEDYSLQVDREKNDEIFENFSAEGIRVSSHFSKWGR